MSVYKAAAPPLKNDLGADGETFCHGSSLFCERVNEYSIFINAYNGSTEDDHRRRKDHRLETPFIWICGYLRYKLLAQRIR